MIFYDFLSKKNLQKVELSKSADFRVLKLVPILGVFLQYFVLNRNLFGSALNRWIRGSQRQKDLSRG